MRIAHTADWHLGKIVNGFSMLEDQNHTLNWMVDDFRDRKIDILVMAGDLYDRANPPKEAVDLANQIFTRLIEELKIPVLVIAGNHDSAERIEYGNRLLEKTGLYIEGKLKQDTRKISIADADFWLVPFADYLHGRQVLGQTQLKNYEEVTRLQVNRIKEEMDSQRLNILLFHGYIINGQPDSVEDSDSERPLSMGGTEYISASLFEDFDYVALGHLHKGQKVKSNRIMYAGSPLKYSKSESQHKKAYSIVDIEKDSINVEKIATNQLRDLRVIRGKLEDLMADSSDDYIFVELTDDSYQLNAMQRLRSAYPYAMGLEYPERKTARKSKKEFTREVVNKRELPDLFTDYYQSTRDKAPSKEQEKIIDATYDIVLKEDQA